MAEETRKKLEAEGFERVERDDRLLDVFPAEVSDKGIELWDKWTDTEVIIVRIHDLKNITRHVFDRKQIESWLVHNKVKKIV